MKAAEFYSELLCGISWRDDVVVKARRLSYSGREYYFLRIASREISPEDKVILIRAGIHGDEIAGPLTLLSFCDAIIDYIHQSGLKCIIYPLGNPSGFEAGLRYNIDNDWGEGGNNDFLRYELCGGKIVDDIGESDDFKRWHWAFDLGVGLPAETKLMHEFLRKDPLSQIAAVIDLHQDYISKFPPAAYHYAFGDLSRYQAIADEIEEFLPVLRDTDIGAGESSPQRSDGQGFIVRHDGTLPDLLFRLGVSHCITVETTGATPLKIAKKVNLIWIFGIVDLVKGGRNGAVQEKR